MVRVMVRYGQGMARVRASYRADGAYFGYAIGLGQATGPRAMHAATIFIILCLMVVGAMNKRFTQMGGTKNKSTTKHYLLEICTTQTNIDYHPKTFQVHKLNPICVAPQFPNTYSVAIEVTL